MNAIAKLTPNVEHRNCARHVYSNWRKKFKDSILHDIFRSIARSTYMEPYKLALEDLKAVDEATYNGFLAREPQRFFKAFISTFL